MCVCVCAWIVFRSLHKFNNELGGKLAAKIINLDNHCLRIKKNGAAEHIRLDRLWRQVARWGEEGGHNRLRRKNVHS
jgi:hypothetical protein